MTRPRRLEGRTCLIVGGTGGIGLASARRFLEEGARVVAAGDESRAGAVGAEGLTSIGQVLERTVDVGSEADVDELFASALEYFGGRLDSLLHVSGISGRRFGDSALHECSAQGWDRVMEVNARGQFLTNRAAVRAMLDQDRDAHGGRGAVVNIGSVLAGSPSPLHFGTIAYAASKGAARALTLGAAARYASEGVRFNLIEPGLVATPMAVRATEDDAIRSYLVAKQPLARGPLEAGDVAEAALFLCEPSARFLTGAIVTVDGGWCVSDGWGMPSKEDAP